MTDQWYFVRQPEYVRMLPPDPTRDFGDSRRGRVLAFGVLVGIAALVVWLLLVTVGMWIVAGAMR